MSISIGKRDVVWSYAGVITSMSANILILPFLIYFLSGDMLGLWYVFVSIGGLTSLFDFGFSVTFARNVTYCWSGVSMLKGEGVEYFDSAGPNYSLLKKILGTCRVVYRVISLTALVLLLVIGTPYVYYVSAGINGPLHFVAWGLYCVAIFMNLYYGYFAVFLRGVGAVAEVNQNTVLARLAQIVVTIVLLFAGFGIVGACAAYLVYGTLFRLLGKRRFFAYRGIGEKLKNVESCTSKEESLKLLRIVWHNAWREGVVSLSNYLSNQASTIICSLYLTLAATGIYSLGVQVAMAVATISATLYTAYQPKLQSAYVSGDFEVVRKTMSLIVMAYVGSFLVGTLIMVTLGLHVLAFIKPESMVPVSVYLGISAYQFLLYFRNCYTSYFSCTNRILYVKAFILSSATCVVLQVALAGFAGLGVWGLIAGQLISQLAFNVWYWPIKAHKEMKLSVGQMSSYCVTEVRSVICRLGIGSE